LSNEEPAPEADLNEVNSSLNEGLKSCHAIVANYRVMLGGDQLATTLEARGRDSPLQQPANDDAGND
jgi:hypothetical protein